MEERCMKKRNMRKRRGFMGAEKNCLHNGKIKKL
jgi:hypothetical protein